MNIHQEYGAASLREFWPGQRFRMNQYLLEIAEGSSKLAIHLRDIASGEIRTITAPMLCKALDDELIREVTSQDSSGHLGSAGQLALSAPGIDENIPASLRSEKAIEVLAAKMLWIKRLRRADVKSLRPTPALEFELKDLEHKYGQKCPFTLGTLYRAQLRLDKHNDDPRSILPAYHRKGGAGGHRLHREVEIFISMALANSARLETGKLQPTKVMQAVDAMVIQHNRANPEMQLEHPSLPTVTRRFNERFSRYEVVCRNYGKQRADREYRNAGARVRAASALDVVQYDDTDTCVFLVDDRTGLPWGRAYLTVGVDEYTGMVMGKAISEQSRSVVSATRAVIDGIMPKNHDDAEFGLCRNDWIAYGQHGLVVLDNASYNTTASLEVSLTDFGCEVEYARPHHPTDKTDIEYFNKILKANFCSNQPGWSGPKEDRRSLKVGMGTAVMTLTEFIRHLNHWIVDEYSYTPRTSGMTPRQLWEQSFSLVKPLLPSRMINTDLLSTLPHQLRFRDSGGLLRNGLRYQCEQIDVLRRKIGSKASVQVRYNPMDLSYLLVQDPDTRNYIRAQCIEDSRYVVGLTDYQHKLVMKYRREMKKKHPHLVELHEARMAIAKETEALMRSKKVIERKRSVRAHQAGLTTEKLIPVTTSVTETVVESDIERWTNNFVETEDDELEED